MRWPFSARRRRLSFGIGAGALLGSTRALAADASPVDATPNGAALAPADRVPSRTTDAPGSWAHAWNPFGEPKYSPGFDHFEWVEPAAPKGGTLYLLSLIHI